MTPPTINHLAVAPARFRNLVSARAMVKLTMYSLSTTGAVVPSTPDDVRQPSPSESSSRSPHHPHVVKVEPAGSPGLLKRRSSPRKRATVVKSEEESDEEPIKPVGDALQLTASQKAGSGDSNAIASSSKLPTSKTSPAKAAKKARRAPAAGRPPLALDPPPHWREQYDAVVEMRKDIIAPVDGMGCAAAGDSEIDPVKARFAVLISLMLSSQTKDEMTHRAVEKLRSDLPGGLSAQALADATDALVRACISCVGFANRKTEYIKLAAVDCLSKHAGDIPRDLDGLLALKGVGPKMAYLVLENAWDDSMGIGVDIHVERLTNRLGWHPVPTNKPSPNPELARRNLESWLPRELWGPINPLFVGFGQTICSALVPKCDECVLGGRGICPSFDPKAAGRARAKAVKLERQGLGKEEASKEAAVEVAGPALEVKLEEEGLSVPPAVKLEEGRSAVGKPEPAADEGSA